MLLPKRPAACLRTRRRTDHKTHHRTQSPPIRDIRVRPDKPSDPLKIVRASFKFIGRISRGGPHAVRTKLVEQVIATVHDPHVRTKELICRAYQEIAAQALYVNGSVRSKLDRVDVNERASIMSHVDHVAYRVDASKRVGCVSGLNQGGSDLAGRSSGRPSRAYPFRG